MRALSHRASLLGDLPGQFLNGFNTRTLPYRRPYERSLKTFIARRVRRAIQLQRNVRFRRPLFAPGLRSHLEPSPCTLLRADFLVTGSVSPVQRYASQVSGPNCPGFVRRETLCVASSNATNGESLPV